MWLWMVLVLGSVLAAPEEQADQSAEEESAEKVIVVSDGFKRWDGTRWFLQTQITFPLPYKVAAFRNFEFEAIAAQVRTVIHCEKAYRSGKRRFEVRCRIEDIALHATPLRPRRERESLDAILLEWDEALTGADIELHVSDDGRVINVDLEGMAGPDGNAEDAETVRGQEVLERMRLLLRLGMAAFHMRLPPSKALKEGQWVEYEPTLFQIPQLVNTMSGAYIIHQLNTYQGHNVVQGKGKGTVQTGMKADGSDLNFFKMSYDGVAIYGDDGVMTERVWAIKGKATASSKLGDLANVGYFHSGRIQQLGEKAEVELPGSHVVGVPGQPGTDERPAWVAIE